jgi:prepilin signal peptidase PulO-like enzyme (type II secretory pathway)
MGAGSVVEAVFVIPWLRIRFSPNFVTLLANLLIVLAYALMALVQQPEAFFVVAALAGVGWTLSAPELWVAAQRAMPSGALERMAQSFAASSAPGGGWVWRYDE